jgi:hypothetical protein
VNIYQNFLNSETHKQIYNQLSGNGFAWYNYKTVVGDSMTQSDTFFVPNVFRHCFVQDYKVQSQWIRLIEPIFFKLKDCMQIGNLEITNLHANWLFPNKSKPNQIDYPHIDKDDFKDDCYTVLYYLNSCDGETILYDNLVESNKDIVLNNLKILDTIRPEANKLVVWEAKRVHSAPAYITEPRMVLNMNIRVAK